MISFWDFSKFWFAILLIAMDDRIISPDSLRKHELKAEFLARGFVTDSDSDLAALLVKCREAKLLEKPVIAEYYSDDIDSENDRIEVALTEFNETVLEFQSTGLTDKQCRRLRHRIIHWKNRNSVIPQLTECNEVLLTQQGRDKKFTDLIENLKFLKTSLSDLSANKDKPVTLAGPSNQISQTSILDLPNNLTSEGLSTQQSQPPIVLQPFPVNSVQQPVEAAGGFRFRMLELSNPVELMIRDFPFFEICEAEQAFQFLKCLMTFCKQVKNFQISDVQILQLISSHTKGRLASLITEAILSQSTITLFQEMIIKEFIPNRLFHSLMSKYYYRTQTVSERFLQFAEDIELVKEALLVPQSEAEAVRMVGIGARLPEVRSLFLGLFPPTTWRQLRDLGPNLNDAAAAHQEKPSGITATPVGSSSRPINNLEFNRTAPNLPNRGIRSPFQCSWCGKTGHSAEKCWARLGRRPVDNRNASVSQRGRANRNP